MNKRAYLKLFGLNKQAFLMKEALRGKQWLLKGLSNITKGILEGRIDGKHLIQGLKIKPLSTGLYKVQSPSRDLGVWLQLRLNNRPATSLFKNVFSTFKNSIASPTVQLPYRAPNSLLQKQVNELYSALRTGKYIPTNLKQAYQNIYNIFKQ